LVLLPLLVLVLVLPLPLLPLPPPQPPLLLEHVVLLHVLASLLLMLLLS